MSMTLQTLADRIDIQELTARYNSAADGTDPGALLAVFTEDASVEMFRSGSQSAVYRGEEIAELVAPAPGQRVHMTMDAIIEIAGDTASQRCTLLLVTRSYSRGVTAFFTG